MPLTTIIIIFSFILFTAYNVYILRVMGVPCHISETYYFFKNSRPSLSILFRLLLCTFGVLMIPVVLMIGKKLSVDIHVLRFLVFLSAFCVLAVAVMANYKVSVTRKIIHYTSAVLSAVSILTLILLADWHLLCVPCCLVPLLSLLAVLTHTYAVAFYYWLELAAIYTIHISLFILSINL